MEPWWEKFRRLRLARGWSHEDAARQFVAVSETHTDAQVESARRSIVRWEHGSVREPKESTKQAIARMFELAYVHFWAAAAFDSTTPAVADNEFPEEAEQLITALARARTMCSSGVEALQTFTNHLRERDRTGGAEHLLYQLQGHQGLLDDAMRYSVAPAIRQKLALVLADTASLHAWHALDMGQPVKAWRAFETAEAAASVGHDPATEAFVAAEKAYALLDVGRPGEARQLIEHVRQAAGSAVPPLMGSWLSAATAEILAACGEENGCREALDMAYSRLAIAAPIPELPFVVLDETHLGRWRGHCLARLGDAESISELEATLPRLDPAFVRARAGVLIDLGIALNAADEQAEADKRLIEGRSLAQQAGSARQLRRISQIQRSGVHVAANRIAPIYN